ncbi:MAG TPA: hypothetical protein VGM27_16190 [Acidobacteriaceae bacterium]
MLLLLAGSAALGIVGGIYDGVLARCAVKAKAEKIYTRIGRHYAQCGRKVTECVRMP